MGLLEWINFSLQETNSKSSFAAAAAKKIDRALRFDKFEEELLALYLTLELLWLVEGLHKHAGIIHGDIKPDNFRLNDNFPQLDVSALDVDRENSPDRVVSVWFGLVNFLIFFMESTA